MATKISIENYRLFAKELLMDKPEEKERLLAFVGDKEVKRLENKRRN